MGRFFLYLLALLLTFLGANALYVAGISRVDWNFSKAIEAREFQGRDFEILVFGNSTAMDGVNTEMISRGIAPAYNFSLGGATLKDNFDQLSFYLKRNEKPRQVWLFLSTCHLSYRNASYNTPIVEYLYSTSKPGFSLENLPLFKFRWMFVENIKKLISPDHRNAQLKRGQLRINRSVPDTSQPSNLDSCLNSTYYHSPEFEYLWKMRRLCDSLHIAFNVYEMPCWQKYQTACKTDSIEVTTENGGDQIIMNLNNQEITLGTIDPKTHWLSENHLNIRGSEAITIFLIQSAKEKELFGKN